MKKIMIVLLMVGSSAYAMNSDEEIIVQDLFKSDAHVSSSSPDTALSHDEWALHHQTQLNVMLIEVIEAKQFENARSLMDIGACFDEGYGESALCRAITNENSETFTFFLELDPPAPILSFALRKAFEKNRPQFAFKLLAKGANLSPELPAEIVAAYEAQLAQATEAPQPQEMTLTTHLTTAAREHASQAVEAVQLFWRRFADNL